MLTNEKIFDASGVNLVVGVDNTFNDLQKIFADREDLSVCKNENGAYLVVYTNDPSAFIIKVSDGLIEFSNGAIKIECGSTWSFKMVSRVLCSSQPSHNAWLWFDENDFDYFVGYFWKDWLGIYREYLESLEALIKYIDHVPHDLLNEDERKAVIISDEFKSYLKFYLKRKFYLSNVEEHVDELLKIIYRISGLDRYKEVAPSLVLVEAAKNS